MKYAIYILMVFVLLMENRVGEFTPMTRALFNSGFYIFAMLVNIIVGRSGEPWEKIIYWGWASLFGIWALSEIADTYIPVPYGDFRILIVLPLISGYAYRYKNNI